ncbi:MAG: glycosyltransferase family 39 protein [Cyanobacteria bacterium P01_A01_bin.114]
MPLPLLIIIGLITRTLIAWLLPPGFDEAYYFLYTQHLDWSYFDHPVMVALTSGVGIWLTGQITPLTLRLGGLLLYTASTGLLTATGRHLFGEKVGYLAAAIATITPLFFLGFGTLASPDSGLIFFWSAAMYVAAREFFPTGQTAQVARQPYQPTARIVLIGGLLGLACLSKYHGFVLGLSLVGFCVTSARHRRVLRSPWLGASLLVFTLTLTPLGYWNAQHGWISFGFHLSTRFEGSEPSGFDPLNVLWVWLAEVGFLFPTVGFPLWWVTVQSIRELIKQLIKPDFGKGIGSTPLAFLLWLGLPIAVGFTLLGGVTSIYPAWPAPGLWCLSLLLARSAANWPQPRMRRWLGGTGAFLGALLLFVLLHISLGTLQQQSRFAIFGGIFSSDSDPTATLIDSVRLRRQIQAVPRVRDAIASADFLVTNEFWLSGYVDMAVSPITTAPVTAFTEDPRGHALWFNPADWLGQQALFISIADFDQAELQREYQPYFSQFERLDEIALKRSGAITETVYIYRVGQLEVAYPYPYS